MTPLEPPAAALNQPANPKASPNPNPTPNPLAGATPKAPEGKPSLPASGSGIRIPERAPVNGTLVSI
jgi:hypothetical protein